MKSGLVKSRESCYPSALHGGINLAKGRITPAYTTRSGRAYQGDALDVLTHFADDSVSLVFTSPPFALRRRTVWRPLRRPRELWLALTS